MPSGLRVKEHSPELNDDAIFYVFVLSVRKRFKLCQQFIIVFCYFERCQQIRFYNGPYSYNFVQLFTNVSSLICCYLSEVLCMQIQCTVR